FVVMTPSPPRATLFPYTTLFRSGGAMQLGMVGLGRMGANMVRRLMRAGHECFVQDLSKDAVDALIKEGAKGTTSLEELPKMMKGDRKSTRLNSSHVAISYAVFCL